MQHISVESRDMSGPTTEQHSMSEPASSSKRTVTITVLYFAAAFTATGAASEVISLPLTSQSEGAEGFPLSALSSFLVGRHANTNLDKVLQTSRWSIDAEMIDDPEGVLLNGGEEVAVICPVSGG